jgi:phage FluMu protein Com
MRQVCFVSDGPVFGTMTWSGGAMESRKRVMIKFRCKYCEAKIGVPNDYAGHTVKCPKCQRPNAVPGAPTTPAGSNRPHGPRGPLRSPSDPATALASAAVDSAEPTQHHYHHQTHRQRNQPGHRIGRRTHHTGGLSSGVIAGAFAVVVVVGVLAYFIGRQQMQADAIRAEQALAEARRQAAPPPPTPEQQLTDKLLANKPTSGYPASIAPDADTPQFTVVQFRADLTVDEPQGKEFRLSMAIRNKLDQPGTVTARVEFCDDTGRVIDTYNEVGMPLEAGQSRRFGARHYLYEHEAKYVTNVRIRLLPTDAS